MEAETSSNGSHPAMPLSELVVERDPAFRHYAADRAIALFLGRDMEIGFLRLNSQLAFPDDPSRAIDQLTSFSYTSTPRLSEVTRVRTTPDAAIGLALTIIGQLSSAGLVNGEALIKTVQQVLAEATAGPDMQGDDEQRSDPVL